MVNIYPRNFHQAVGRTCFVWNMEQESLKKLNILKSHKSTTKDWPARKATHYTPQRIFINDNISMAFFLVQEEQQFGVYSTFQMCRLAGVCVAYMQRSSRTHVDVEADVITQILERLHHTALGGCVAPQQCELRVWAVNLMSYSHVSQQHEFLHQPVIHKYILFRVWVVNLTSYDHISKQQTPPPTCPHTHLLLSLYW